MSHRAWSESELAHEADWVVVGSGPGGASIAVTLARGGADVTLVEAGAWRDPDDYPHSAYGAMRDLMDDWGATITRGRALWPVVQARAVGGTSVINSAICVRTPEDIFDQWVREHGLPDHRAAFARHQDEIERELCVEEVPAGSLGRSNELALLGGERRGLDGHVMRRYVRGCEGSGQCLQGCRRRTKQSLNLNYVPELISRGGTLVSCAPVKRVVFEGEVAVGVEGRFRHPAGGRRGGRFRIRARRGVIVAGSATQSPALLQRSGVRHPALGKHFRAHPGTGVFGVYDQPVDQNVGVTQGWASTKFRSDPGMKLETLSIPLELVASRLAGAGPTLMARLAEYRHIAMWCVAVRADTVGTVSSGLFDRPVVRYEMQRPDMERLRFGMKLLAEQHFAAGARAVIPGIHGMPYQLGPDEVSRLDEAPLDPRCYIAILSHLFGGCAMGADPERALCDPWGAVRGRERLYVADASLIPTNLGVNPQHTIMALAKTIGEHLLGD